MKIYYGVPSEIVGRVVSCGLDSEYYNDAELYVDGRSQKCIFACIVPDDVGVPSETHTILELDVDPSKVYVAEGAFRSHAEENFAVFEAAAILYENSFVKLKDYRFGDYVKPECIVSMSILPESVAEYNPKRGFPVVYENSSDLYSEKIFHEFCEKYGDIRMYAIRCCCEALCNAGKMKKQKVGTNLVFIDNKTGEKFVIPGN